MNTKNFSERVKRARSAAQFANIVTRDARNRARVVYVPGHSGARYRVILRHETVGDTNVLSAECAKDCGVVGFDPCKAKCVCYHSIAAVIAAAADARYDVRVAQSPKDAMKLCNFGGHVAALYSWTNKTSSPIFIHYTRFRHVSKQ